MERTDGASRPRLTAGIRRIAIAGPLLLLWGCAPASVEPPSAPPASPAPPPTPPAEAEAPVEEPMRLADLDIGPVERVLVDKSDRRLYLMRGSEILAWAPVGLGRQPTGAKRQEGDRRTPEGDYMLDWRNPNSRYYRAIHISYPNEQDLARAFETGVNPGGAIFIHGTPDPLLLERDWTTGCIAVSNRDMDLIWTLVPDGTPITIRP